MGDELGDARRALRGDAFTGVTRASRDLGISERWLRDAIARGEVPTYRLGSRARVKVADVRRWLETRRTPPR